MYQPLQGSDNSDDDANDAGAIQVTSIRPAAKIEFFEQTPEHGALKIEFFEETPSIPYMKLVNEEDMDWRFYTNLFARKLALTGMKHWTDRNEILENNMMWHLQMEWLSWKQAIPIPMNWDDFWDNFCADVLKSFIETSD